jgi:DNA polymerase-1
VYKRQDDSKLRAQTFGYVKTKMGRTRHLDRVKAIYEVFEDGLLDYRVFKKLEAGMDAIRKQKLVSLKLEYRNGINNSRNFQIQGLAASIMNRSAIRIHKEFKERGVDARIMLQIHDEFVINSSLKDVEISSEIVKRCMETTVEIPTGLIAEPNIALNFGEGHV